MRMLQNSQKLFSEMLELKNIEEGFIADKFNETLKQNVRIPGHVAMDIYRNNSIGARQRALQIIYPVVEKIIGEQCFSMMTSDFVTSSFSLDADLNNFGAGFVDFLADQILVQSEFTDFVYLPDLLRLEWHYHAAYYAPDDAPLPTSPPVTHLTEKERTIHLFCSNSLHQLTTDFPVYDIWLAHQGEEIVAEVPALTEADNLIVYRQNNHPEIERINRFESMTLQVLTESHNVEHVVEIMVKKGVDVQHMLPSMIEKGWLRVELQQRE